MDGSADEAWHEAQGSKTVNRVQHLCHALERNQGQGRAQAKAAAAPHSERQEAASAKRAGGAKGTGSSQGGAASSLSTSGQPPYLVRRRVDSIFTFLQLYTLSLGELLASESILSPLQPYCKDRNNYEYYFFFFF